MRCATVCIMVLLLLIACERCPAETAPETIAESVQQFLRAWETGDLSEFESHLHDDLEFAYPGGRLDKEQLIALFQSYRKEKEDIRIYLWDQVIIQGGSFATAYQFAATDRSTGLRQAVGTGVTGRMRDGKIVLFKEYFDEAVAIEQYAGRLPLDEGPVSPWPASIWLRPDTID